MTMSRLLRSALKHVRPRVPYQGVLPRGINLHPFRPVGAGMPACGVTPSFNVPVRMYSAPASIPVSAAPTGQPKPQDDSTNLHRGKDRAPLSLKVGSRLHGFEVTEVLPVPERHLTSYMLTHSATGAKWLHFDTEDTNNVFSVTFKTTPHDSTGVAHILEHTTLCGSQRYPVRDPFFNMLKRSLNTYMNAWTTPDHTSYPFATQNKKDFYNLLGVYADATFFPKLEEIDFRQEGHRLEFDQIDDPSSRLQFKGVVYNEMKGALGDPSSLFCERVQQNLYPTTTYQYNSGGDPLDIPSLTYNQLKEFHSTHYHPANAWFFSYGDLPLSDHLAFANEHALAHFAKNPAQVVDTNVSDEVRWSEPRTVRETCPPLAMGADPERQTKVSVSFLLNNIAQDHFVTFSLSLLSNLLTNGPNSPMYKALIESGVGFDYSPDTGYSGGLREASFSVGLSGVKAEDADRIEQLVMDTLAKAAEEGFEPSRVESILHQIEMSQKTVTADFGLRLVSSMTNAWVHGGHPARPLLLNQTIQRLHDEMRKGTFFQDLIRKHLLSNKHRLTFMMSPDPEHVKRDQDREAALLADTRSKLTPEDLKQIIDQATTLKGRQEAHQDISILPTLTIADIAPSEPITPISHETIERIPVQWVDQPTNGLTYLRALLDLRHVPDALQMYVPLFASVLTDMGAGSLDHRQLAQEMDMYTGGIGASPLLAVHHSDLDSAQASLFLKASCLNRNMPRMLDLIRDIFLSPKLNDQALLKTLLAGRMSSLQESVSGSGQSYARSFASAGLSAAGRTSELWHGFTQVSFMQRLSRDDTKLDEVIDKLQQLARYILRADVMKCAVITEQSNVGTAKSNLGRFFQEISGSSSSLPVMETRVPAQDSPAALEWARQAYFVVPSAAVNYVSQVTRAVPYTHPDSAKLELLGRILSSCFLHTEIREKGGAYGGGASLGGGAFSYYSYRDPHPEASVQTFGKVMQYLERDSAVSAQDLQEGKLSVFGDLDAPEAPSHKGMSEFKRDITHEMRATRRQRLLEASKSDLLEVAARYLDPASPGFQQRTAVAVVGGAAEWATKEKGWDVRTQ